MANLAFDASQVDPTNEFEVLPAGDYTVMIVDSEMKPTKDQQGQYLQLTEEVLDGPYKGRKFWDRLNLVNPNQQAVEIAQRTLSQSCHAVGILQVQDSAELHNRPLVARLKVRPARGQYSESNEVAQYKPASQTQGTGQVGGGQPAANQGAAAPAQAAPTAQATPQQPAPTEAPNANAGSVPPWQR